MEKTLLLLFSIIFIVSCRKSEIENTKKIKNHEIIINDSLIISQEGLNTISIHDSLIYITNAYTNEIVEYDFQGKKRNTFGRTGRGPGEFSSIGLIAVNDSMIAVSDNADQKIKCFNKDGIFTNNLHTNDFGVYLYTALGFVKDTLFYEQHSISKDSENMVRCISQGYFDKYDNVTIDSKKSIVKQRVENPLEKLCYFYLLGDSYVKEINDEGIEYNNETKSIRMIPFIAVTPKIKHFYKEYSNSDNNIEFPEYMPKIYAIYKIENKLLILSYYQQYLSMIGSENTMYIMDINENTIEEIKVPGKIKTANINNIFYDKYIILTDYENEKLSIYNINISEILPN